MGNNHLAASILYANGGVEDSRNCISFSMVILLNLSHKSAHRSGGIPLAVQVDLQVRINLSYKSFTMIGNVAKS